MIPCHTNSSASCHLLSILLQCSNTIKKWILSTLLLSYKNLSTIGSFLLRSLTKLYDLKEKINFQLIKKTLYACNGNFNEATKQGPAVSVNPVFPPSHPYHSSLFVFFQVIFLILPLSNWPLIIWIITLNHIGSIILCTNNSLSLLIPKHFLCANWNINSCTFTCSPFTQSMNINKNWINHP